MRHPVFSLSLVTALVVLASTACTGKVLEVGTAQPGGASGGPGAPSAGPPVPSDGVVAVIDNHGVWSLTSDETNLYFGDQNGDVYSVAKATGVATRIVDGTVVGGSTHVSSVIVDGDQLLLSSVWSSQIVRLSKAGGAIEVVADRLLRPGRMVVDGTNLYVAVEDNAAPSGPALLRIPKAGGAPAFVASIPPNLTALVLSDTHVYFAAGYELADTSIRRVAKAGGAVEVLATGIDTRVGAEKFGSGVQSIALAGESVAFVEPSTQRLWYVPVAGGTTMRTPPTSLAASALVSGLDAALYGVSVAADGTSAAFVRLGAAGAIESTFSTWTQTPGLSLAVTAMVAEADRVYWVDEHWPLNRTVIRSARLR